MHEPANDFDQEIAQLFASPPPMPEVTAVAQRLEARAHRLQVRRTVAIFTAVGMAVAAAVVSVVFADPAAVSAIIGASLQQGMASLLRLPSLQPGPGGVDLFWLGVLLLLLPILIAVMAPADEP